MHGQARQGGMNILSTGTYLSLSSVYPLRRACADETRYVSKSYVPFRALTVHIEEAQRTRSRMRLLALDRTFENIR